MERVNISHPITQAAWAITSRIRIIVLTGWVRMFFMGILFSFNALFTAGLLRKKE